MLASFFGVWPYSSATYCPAGHDDVTVIPGVVGRVASGQAAWNCIKTIHVPPFS